MIERVCGRLRVRLAKKISPRDCGPRMMSASCKAVAGFGGEAVIDARRTPGPATERVGRSGRNG